MNCSCVFTVKAVFSVYLLMTLHSLLLKAVKSVLQQ